MARVRSGTCVRRTAAGSPVAGRTARSEPRRPDCIPDTGPVAPTALPGAKGGVRSGLDDLLEEARHLLVARRVVHVDLVLSLVERGERGAVLTIGFDGRRAELLAGGGLVGAEFVRRGVPVHGALGVRVIVLIPRALLGQLLVGS